MNKRKLIIIGSIAVIIVLSIIIMGTLSGMRDEVEKKEKEDIKRYVKAIPVKYENSTSILKETGRVASQNYVDLSPEVRGKILPGNVSLKKGQSFRKGQVLLRIYSAEFQLALQAKKSRFLTLTANILPDLKIDFNSSYQLWLDFFEKIDIKKTFPELPEIKSNKEKIFLSSRNILSEYYAIKSDEIMLSKYYLYAPFNGSFTEVYSEPGAVANPGVRIARMIRTDKLELEVPVETANIKYLKVGNTVEIISDNQDENSTGKISRISDFVDPKTQSVSVFIDLNRKKNSTIYQGEYMTAVFSNILLKDAMEIPRDAVFNQNQVFTVKNGKLKKQNIHILKMNDETIFFKGLETGIYVVTEALINAVDNLEVEVLK